MLHKSEKYVQFYKKCFNITKTAFTITNSVYLYQKLRAHKAYTLSQKVLRNFTIVRSFFQHRMDIVIG